MRSHELARLLLSVEDREVECSVDISTCDEDSGRRAFGDLLEINDLQSDPLTLLFEGSLNE
jgi:hypothetical protein